MDVFSFNEVEFFTPPDHADQAWQSISAAIAYNTLTGFFLMAANVAITAIPVTVIPKEIMGVSMGIINFGNQMAGFLAPTIIAFLVQFS